MGFRASPDFHIQEFPAELVFWSQPGGSKELCFLYSDQYPWLVRNKWRKGGLKPHAHGTRWCQLRWSELQLLDYRMSKLNCNILNCNPSILQQASRAPPLCFSSQIWLENQKSPQNSLLFGQAQLTDKMKCIKDMLEKGHSLYSMRPYLLILKSRNSAFSFCCGFIVYGA